MKFFQNIIQYFFNDFGNNIIFYSEKYPMNYVAQHLVSCDTNSVLALLTRGVKSCIIRKILLQVFPDKSVKQN